MGNMIFSNNADVYRLVQRFSRSIDVPMNIFVMNKDINLPEVTK